MSDLVCRSERAAASIVNWQASDLKRAARMNWEAIGAIGEIIGAGQRDVESWYRKWAKVIRNSIDKIPESHA